MVHVFFPWKLAMRIPAKGRQLDKNERLCRKVHAVGLPMKITISITHTRHNVYIRVSPRIPRN